jgi:hypothetical protein
MIIINNNNAFSIYLETKYYVVQLQGRLLLILPHADTRHNLQTYYSIEKGMPLKMQHE